MSTPHFPLLLEPEIFSQHLNAENILLIDVSREKSYMTGHVPGAIRVEYAQLVHNTPPIGGLLPDMEHLGQLFSALGLTPNTHVVAYDDEGGGKAGRLAWTLHLLGHRSCSVLNGGIHAWANERHPLTREPTQPPPSSSNYTASLKYPEVVAGAEYILENLNNPHIALLDTRTPEEYSGHRKFAARSGHIPGAVNVNWILTLDRAHNLRWKPERELRTLFEDVGITPNKEVIVYCQTQHRASHVYVVLKSLGYPNVRGYPGSWSEWGNLMGVPVEQQWSIHLTSQGTFRTKLLIEKEKVS